MVAVIVVVIQNNNKNTFYKQSISSISILCFNIVFVFPEVGLNEHASQQ